MSMKQYWPVATRIRDNGETEPLFTYDSALSLEKAKAAFATWERDYKYKLKDCHIDVYDGDKKIKVINCESW